MEKVAANLTSLAIYVARRKAEQNSVQHTGFLACGVMSTFYDLRSVDSH